MRSWDHEPADTRHATDKTTSTIDEEEGRAILHAGIIHHTVCHANDRCYFLVHYTSEQASENKLNHTAAVAQTHLWFTQLWVYELIAFDECDAQLCRYNTATRLDLHTQI